MYNKPMNNDEKELIETMNELEAKQNKVEVLNFARALLIGEQNIKRQYGLYGDGDRKDRTA